ncbi:hypothetical protein ACOMHN_005362 [Nucella lapillus]
MTVIKPVFTDLAKTELLRKCVQGYMQNANESINNLVWKLCPKTKNHGITTVNTAVALAVCIFNDGATLMEAVLNRMNIEAGDFAKTFFAHKDTYRILTSQTRAQLATKESRRRRRLQRLGRDEEGAKRRISLAGTS